MTRRFMVLGLVASVVVAVVAVAAVRLGSEGVFRQVDSAADLRVARGIVHDVNEDGWTISGEWVLRCKESGCGGDAAGVRFDMAHVMVLQDGLGSHSHVYSDFSATTVTLGADSLTIEGTITGSGPVGPTDIVIDLVDIVSGNSEFLVELTGNAHLTGQLGGVIVESKQ